MAKKELEELISFNIEEMAQAGLHLGHRTSKLHPKMLPYIYGARNFIHIIDLERTKEKLKEALEFIYNLIADKKTLLIIGTKIHLKELVKNFAEELGLPYVNERWLGGTFTNFSVIKKRCEKLKELEAQFQQKETLEKYTKKEKQKMEQRLKKLKLKFGGIKNLERLPDAILVLDMQKDALAVKEAREKKIKIVAIADTNCDPTLVDFPIPANDNAISSVKYILDKVKQTIVAARGL